MANEISNSHDVLDSRDVIARIEELEAEREALQYEYDEADAARTELSDKDGQETDYAAADDRVQDAKRAINEWDASDEADELKALQSLQSDLEGYCDDWRHGVALVRDSYFEDYAQELAEDIGAIDAKAAWPNTCIDWEKAARELQMDYTSAEFDGVTYWAR